MKKTVIWVVSILALIFLMTGAVFLYEKLSDEYAPEIDIADDAEDVDYRAPDFEVIDNSGNTVKLSDFFGKPIVLNFWASWCPPCKAEMPDFEEAYKKYGEDINFVMVNSTGGRETLATAKEFLAGTDYTFPVYFDTKYDAAMTYGVNALPTTIFIDKDGNLVTYANGMLDSATLQRGIDMIKEQEFAPYIMNECEDGGVELEFFSKDNQEIFHKKYSDASRVHVMQVNEALYKIENSTGVNSNYTIFIDIEKAKVSVPYFNLLFSDEKMVAVMKEKTIYLTDMFDGEKVYESISRDFTDTAVVQSAILSFEMNDDVIYLSYLAGEKSEEKSEQIKVKYNT